MKLLYDTEAFFRAQVLIVDLSQVNHWYLKTVFWQFCIFYADSFTMISNKYCQINSASFHC